MPSTSCKSYEFECGNNWCIPADWACDTHDDCGDDSDEDGDLCGESNWRLCSALALVHHYSLRLIVADRICNSNQFTCDSGQCTFQSWVCDGEQDCEDNSDEKSCAGIVCVHPYVELLTH